MKSFTPDLKDTAISKIEFAFQKQFGDTTGMTVLMAPGRVNLIGEHTDYNEGFVLPMTVDHAVYLGLRSRSDDECKVYSINFEEAASWSLNNIENTKNQHWSNYLKGVMKFILDTGRRITGIEGIVFGDIPIGSGLGSSAAVEIAMAYGLQQLFQLEIDPVELILLAQRAENDFVGVQCGIMDQFVSRLGKKDHALFLDCRTLDHELIPLMLDDLILLIVDTKVKHKLAESAYNQRRAECNEAVRFFRSLDLSIKALRDVSPDMFHSHKHGLPEVIQRRAAHVISENQRVLDAVSALRMNKKQEFGEMLYESHRSLKGQYEVSCDELDYLVDNARILGAIGARLTGAGFGGSVLMFVYKELAEEFGRKIAESYQRRFGYDPTTMPLKSNLEPKILIGEN